MALHPPLNGKPTGIITCTPKNLDRAIARAYARGVLWAEFWMVELHAEVVVDCELTSRKAQK